MYFIFFKSKEIETAKEQAYLEKEDLLNSLRKQVRLHWVYINYKLIDFKIIVICVYQVDEYRRKNIEQNKNIRNLQDDLDKVLENNETMINSLKSDLKQANKKKMAEIERLNNQLENQVVSTY